MLQGPISVDADKTNNRGEVSQPAAKAESRRWVNEDPSCSPLFPASPASQRFHKGFKSTACGSALGELYVWLLLVYHQQQVGFQILGFKSTACGSALGE